MIKKYQVAEKQNGSWIILDIDNQLSMGWQCRGLFDALDEVEYSTAAEAQERADELNEDQGYESAINK